jgi:hypothetical protein
MQPGQATGAEEVAQLAGNSAGRKMGCRPQKILTGCDWGKPHAAFHGVLDGVNDPAVEIRQAQDIRGRNSRQANPATLGKQGRNAVRCRPSFLRRLMR